VLRDEGDRSGALVAYRRVLAIRETLAAKDPGNTGWQRDLSVSHTKIGDVLLAEGDRSGALAAYRKDLAIAEALAAKDPGNAKWQRDLILSLMKMSDAEPEAAKKHLTEALRIATGLRDSGRLAPVDAWMPEDLERLLAALGESPARKTKRKPRPPR
jgi:tetratricopeptide (TPR) repeat protein